MAHDELPLRDYDQLSINDLRHRVRSLDEARQAVNRFPGAGGGTWYR